MADVGGSECSRQSLNGSFILGFHSVEHSEVLSHFPELNVS